MAEGKKSFIAYSDWKGMFENLPDEIAGKLIKHVFSYVNDENPETDNFMVKALFEPIKATLKRDLVKWENQTQQRKEAGKKSAEKRASQKEQEPIKPIETPKEIEPTKSNDRSNSFNETERNSTVNVSVSVNDNVSVNVNDNDKEIDFIKPPKELKKPTKKEKVKIELDFLGEFFEENNISIDFFESVKEWITYKNSKKEFYQKETFKIQLNKWLEWANYDKEILKEMIDKAIGANWSGLFKPNKPNNYTPKGKQPKTLEQMNYNEINDYAKEIGGMNLYMQVMLISENNLPEKIKAIKQYQINQKFNNLNGF